MSEMQKRILERQLVGKGIPAEDKTAAAFTMPDKPGRKPEPKKNPRRSQKKGPLERLPHASMFHSVYYDGNTQTWTGKLEVPAQDQKTSKTFSSSCSGVHGLLMKLFQLYKKSLAKGGTS